MAGKLFFFLIHPQLAENDFVALSASYAHMAGSFNMEVSEHFNDWEYYSPTGKSFGEMMMCIGEEALPEYVCVNMSV